MKIFIILMLSTILFGNACTMYYTQSTIFVNKARSTNNPVLKAKYYNVSKKYIKQYNDCMENLTKNTYYQGYR